MRTLSEIDEGQKVKVRHFHCGHGLKHRLCSLGITHGQTITVLKNDVRGPVIVRVFDSKLAIGRGQAMKIYIEPEK